MPTPSSTPTKDATAAVAQLGAGHAHHGSGAAAPQGGVAQGATAGASAPKGGGGVAQEAHAFHKKDSTWRQIPGRASESPQARQAFDVVQSLVAKYPTEAALKAAGFNLDKGSTNHYNVSALNIRVDGVTLKHLVVKDGNVDQAQFDSRARNASDAPPSWSGVQWHYHDHGNSSWMFHVSAGQGIDQAFIEQHAH